MKIALFTDGVYPYVFGGMQKHSYYLCKYLAQQKVKVDLYHTGPAEAETVALKGFTKEELSFINSIFIIFPSLGKFPGHYLIESYIYSKNIYCQFLKGEKVDLIYCQGLTGWKTISEKFEGENLPLIISNLHGLNMYQYNASFKGKVEAQLFRFATNNILKKSDYVVSLGGQLTQLLEEVGVNKNKIIEQPIGIEKDWIIDNLKVKNTLGKNRRFVFIGRYDKVKGINLLTDVLINISDMKFEFFFIGPIPSEKQLKQRNIHYFGLIKEEQEIKKILSGADILVCPSFSEGMPTVILEAMASGLAIIATNVGAVNPMVSEENGWLIKVADKQALKRSIIEAIEMDGETLYQKKKNSLKRVKEHFTWNTIIKTTIDEFYRLKK